MSEHYQREVVMWKEAQPIYGPSFEEKNPVCNCHISQCTTICWCTVVRKIVL